MVYNEVSKFPCENNWANEVTGPCTWYGLSTDDWYVKTTGINERKDTEKYAVRNYALRLLKSQCKENKKTKISVLKNICSQST